MTVMMMVIMVKIKINFKTLPPDANKDFCVLHFALCSPPTLCSSPPTFSQLIVTFLFLPQEKVNLHLRNIFFHETISKLTLQFLHTALLYRRTWHYKSSRNLWIVLVAKSLSVLTKSDRIWKTFLRWCLDIACRAQSWSPNPPQNLKFQTLFKSKPLWFW